MFRVCISFLTAFSLVLGGLPSVVCLGNCRHAESQVASTTASCCSVHATQPTSKHETPAGSMRVSGHKCCCCAKEANKPTGSEKYGAIESQCRSNCACCISTTPQPIIVSRGTDGQENQYRLLFESWTPADDAKLPVENRYEVAGPIDPGGPPGSRDIPLNVLNCVWTV